MVTASPRSSLLPEDCPTYGSRPDRHGYDGVHHTVWWIATEVRSAVYAPDSYTDEAVAAGLARSLAEIDAFDWSEMDVERRVEQVDTSVDDEGITGPGLTFGSCDDDRGLPTEREALAAAADLRRRLWLPEQD